MIVNGTDLFSAIGQAFAAPLSWFVDCLTASSLIDAYLAVVFISVAVAMLLKPLRGDTSNKSKVGDD